MYKIIFSLAQKRPDGESLPSWEKSTKRWVVFFKMGMLSRFTQCAILYRSECKSSTILQAK